MGAIAYERGQRGESASCEGPQQIGPEGGLKLPLVHSGGPLGAPLGDLPAHRADDVSVDRGDRRHDGVHVDAAECRHHSLPAGQRVRPKLRPPADQVGEPFVLVSGLPGGLGQGAQHLSPPSPVGRISA